MTEGAAPAGTVPARDNEVGEALARARATLGLSLEDCAQQIKFSAKKLEALEQGRYAELPGGTFARGMLRAYARLLNLDPDKLVPRIAQQVEVPDTTAAAVSLRRPIPFAQPGKRSNLLYAALSLAAMAIVAWVGYEWQQERGVAAKLTFVPAAQAPAEKPAPAVVATVTPAIAPIAQEPAAAAPKPPSAAEAPVAEAAKPEAEKPEATKPGAEPPAGPPAAGKRRLVLAFEREAWVEVRGADGKKIHSQVNRAGTERVLDGEPPLRLIIGNARHVRVTYDDHAVDLSPYTKVEVARLTLD